MKKHYIFYFISAIFSFFIITNITFSQNYIRVTATKKYNSTEEGKYENIYVYNFRPSYSYYSNYEKCKITFYVVDKEGNPLVSDNIVRAFTGFKSEYLEAEESTNSEGYVELNLSTDNLLSDLNLIVCFNGYDGNAILQNVNFSYSKKKFDF